MYPSDELRARLGEVEPYPTDVCAVPQPLPYSAFFPGGAGVILGEDGSKPPFPFGQVMIVGHNFYNLAGFEKMQMRQARDAGTPTWRNLTATLKRADIALESCFFTNAYQGLMETTSSMGAFPGARDADFVERCRAFFRVQLSVCQPRLVLTLGVHVPPFLAPLSDDLGAKWRGEKKPLTFAQIDENGGGLIQTGVRDAEGKERKLTFVAMTHPAQQWPNVRRRRYGNLESLEAEEALLRAGLELSGVKQPNFPLRGTFGEIHDPFEPAVAPHDWDALSQDELMSGETHEP